MRRFRWRQVGYCPFTCPVCQDVTLHERKQVVVEVTRPLRGPVDLPYAPMARCPACGHVALVERGFGDGFKLREGETPYDAMVRFFGPDHRELALADAYRNARAFLTTNESRWQLTLHAFSHASYEQFVPPRGSLVRRTTLNRLTIALLSLFIGAMAPASVAGLTALFLPKTWHDGLFLASLILTAALLIALSAWHARCFWKEWSVEIHRRRATPRVQRLLARMLRGVEPDGMILRDAIKTAREHDWITARIDPEAVLLLVQEEQRAAPSAIPSPDMAEHA